MSFRKLFAGEHRLRIEADGLRQMRRHIAIVAADHLDADAEPVEVVDRALRVRLGRVVEDEKAAKGHVLFVVAAVVLLCRDLAGRHGQNAKAFGPLGLEDILQFGAPFGISGTSTPSRSSDEQMSSTFANAPLVTMRCCDGSPSSATTMVRRRRMKS